MTMQGTARRLTVALVVSLMFTGSFSGLAETNADPEMGFVEGGYDEPTDSGLERPFLNAQQQYTHIVQDGRTQVTGGAVECEFDGGIFQIAMYDVTDGIVGAPRVFVEEVTLPEKPKDGGNGYKFGTYNFQLQEPVDLSEYVGRELAVGGRHDRVRLRGQNWSEDFADEHGWGVATGDRDESLTDSETWQHELQDRGSALSAALFVEPVSVPEGKAQTALGETIHENLSETVFAAFPNLTPEKGMTVEYDKSTATGASVTVLENGVVEVGQGSTETDTLEVRVCDLDGAWHGPQTITLVDDKSTDDGEATLVAARAPDGSRLTARPDGPVYHSSEGTTHVFTWDEPGPCARVVLYDEDETTHWGGGPNTHIYDTMERPNAAAGDVPRRIAPHGKWDRYSGLPELHSNSHSGEFSARIQDKNSGRKFKARFEETTEVFLSYALKIPDGKAMLGGEESGEFPESSVWKMAWLFNEDTSDDVDICLPSWTPSLSIGGNSLNPDVAIDDNKKPAWWLWGEWMRFSIWLECGDDPANDPGRIRFQVVAEGEQTRVVADGEDEIMSDGEPPYAWKRLNILGWSQNKNVSGDNVEALYDDIYLATGADANARVELTDNSVYEDSTRMQLCKVRSWSDNRVSAVLNKGSLDAVEGSTIHLTTADEQQVVSMDIQNVTPDYNVSFKPGDRGTRTGGGRLEQTVAHGESATAPTIEADDGWSFTGWDTDFSSVTSDLTVNAQYEETIFSSGPEIGFVDAVKEGTENSSTRRHLNAREEHTHVVEDGATQIVGGGIQCELDGGTFQIGMYDITDGVNGKASRVFMQEVTLPERPAPGGDGYKIGTYQFELEPIPLREYVGCELAVAVKHDSVRTWGNNWYKPSDANIYRGSGDGGLPDPWQGELKDSYSPRSMGLFIEPVEVPDGKERTVVGEGILDNPEQTVFAPFTDITPKSGMAVQYDETTEADAPVAVLENGVVEVGQGATEKDTIEVSILDLDGAWHGPQTIKLVDDKSTDDGEATLVAARGPDGSRLTSRPDGPVYHTADGTTHLFTWDEPVPGARVVLYDEDETTDWGGGPDLHVYDTMERPDAEAGDTASLRATYGKWRRSHSGAPELRSNSHSGEFSARVQDRNDLNRFQTEFAETTEVFLSYCVKIPDGKAMLGADEPGEFPESSVWKMAWLFNEGTSAGEDVDICLPSWTPILSIGGNSLHPDAEITDAKRPDWWQWGEWMRFSFWLECGPEPETDPGRIRFQAVMEGEDTRVLTDAREPIMQDRRAAAPYSWKRLNIPGWSHNKDVSGENVEALYDDIYFATGSDSNARVELTDNSVYEDSTRMQLCKVRSWSSNRVSAVLNKGSLDAVEGSTIHLTTADEQQVVSMDIQNLTPDYNVSFKPGDRGTRTGGGKLEQTVEHGESASEPTIEVDNGWTFGGWDTDITNVTEDLIVRARYNPVDNDADSLSDAWEQQIVDAADDIDSIEDVNPEDDFNGSGRSNRVEYAFGMDPTAANETPLTVEIAKDENGNSQLEATFNVRSPGLDMGYVMQTCSDLKTGDWSGGSLFFENDAWQSSDARVSVVSQSEKSEGLWEITVRLQNSDTSNVEFFRVGLE